MPVLIVGIASAVNPHVSREDAHEFWTAVSNARCVARLTEHERKWLQLATAVGLRSADAMATLGAELSMHPGTLDSIRGYALMSGVAGLVAASRLREGDHLLRDGLAKLPQAERMHPAFVLLAGVTAYGVQ
jgi:hypothetical protein